MVTKLRIPIEIYLLFQGFYSEDTTPAQPSTIKSIRKTKYSRITSLQVN